MFNGKKIQTPMACVYAGPDSLYWKTGNPNDVNKSVKGNNDDTRKKLCPKCGSANDLTNRYCTECGTKFTYPEARSKI